MSYDRKFRVANFLQLKAINVKTELMIPISSVKNKKRSLFDNL